MSFAIGYYNLGKGIHYYMYLVGSDAFKIVVAGEDISNGPQAKSDASVGGDTDRILEATIINAPRTKHNSIY